MRNWQYSIHSENIRTASRQADYFLSCWTLYRLLRIPTAAYRRIAWILRHFPVINFMVFGCGICLYQVWQENPVRFWLVGGQEVGQTLNDGEFELALLRQPALRLSMERQEVFARGRLRWRRFSLKSCRSIRCDDFLRHGRFCPYTNLWYQGVRGEVVVHAFEDYEIYISRPPALALLRLESSRTLIAMGVEKSYRSSSCPVSVLDLDNDRARWSSFDNFKIITRKN